MGHVITVPLPGGTVESEIDEAEHHDTSTEGRVVLLPALSSISTRGEMRPLLERLAPSLNVASLDWPGFGTSAKPRRDWTPALLSAFLDHALDDLGATAVVAAGHAAAYALDYAARHPGRLSRLVLVAPTWRGPLPTMMQGPRPWFARIRAAVDAPLIGPLLYRLNLSGPVIARMARQHVYSDPGWLVGPRLAEKHKVTTAAGARHGSVRFVTGALDRLDSRDAFLDLARRAGVPLLVILGEETPPRSRAEMEALGALPNVELRRLPKGRLGVHEEFPDEVAALALPFLTG
ncbi:alpha/beta fold hydrolase [Ancylobacter sp. SL191]|uniref:alpha/beta fold hydrolase n=1 Tax=Ancylobacter sp. SL191 TaxID=2995166 RepID=UPI00226FA726|nr:alpha/beta hydrolase [Ancylobacter sp. SL191]WAC27149.1 alpha/beta hydrolase [Ancylobacter sp. SL191]